MTTNGGPAALALDDMLYTEIAKLRGNVINGELNGQPTIDQV